MLHKDYLQFYLRIAGGQNEACRGAEERAESVLLQFSTDGGISWNLLQEMHHLEYRQPRSFDSSWNGRGLQWSGRGLG